MKAFLLWIALTSLLPFTGTAQDSMAVGKYKKIWSGSLSGEVTYLEHLPEGYDKSKMTYPVLYLMNAQDPATFANACATIDYLSSERIPDMIVIGICNDGVASNYWACPDDSGHTTGADQFNHFLEQELIPEVNKNYRANAYKILMGQSNTGLFVLNNLLTHPGLFDSYIVASPMLGWCPGFFLDETKKFLKDNPELKRSLYITYGDLDYVEVTGKIDEFERMLQAQSPAGFKWKLDPVRNEGHVPYITLHDGLLFIFSECTMTAERRKFSVTEIQSHFEKISEEYGFAIQPKGSVLFDMAIDLKNQKKYEEAIVLFNYLVGLYPDKSLYHYGLGITHYQKGDIKSAKESFKKALEADPEDELSKKMLERLEQLK